MTRPQLVASRALWHRREIVAYRLWRSRVKRLGPSDPRRAGAYLTWRHAHDERVHRDQQISRLVISTVSDAFVEFVKAEEGGQGSGGLFHPYWDPNGRVWTQGYGHVEGVKPSSKPWTEAEATQMLRRDLNGSYAAAVRKCIARFGLLNVTQCEFDALDDVAYNLGPGAILGSVGFETLTRALRSGVRDAIGRAFLIYDHSGGQRLLGLTLRRQAEQAMLVSGQYRKA